MCLVDVRQVRADIVFVALKGRGTTETKAFDLAQETIKSRPRKFRSNCRKKPIACDNLLDFGGLNLVELGFDEDVI
jgi:hypothetical protein